MKKTKIILSLVMFLLMTTLAWGVSSITGKWQGSRTVLIYDTIHLIDANQLMMFVYNNGNFAYDNANVGPAGKTDGLYYPNGTLKTVVYDAGLWLGAKVNNQVRIAMAEYSSEFVPGPMANGTFQPDKAEFKVYKVNRGDNASTNPDYRDWPAGQGAPVDNEGKPAIIGDQFLWSACNDADLSKHTNNAGGTQPLGVEVQQSTFAYARGGALGNTVFMKFKLINKGGNRLDSAYVSLWADPDLGDPGDDLVGCDTALSLGYCYNSGVDAIYGAAPPAVGFDFFQGPIVPGEPTDSAYAFGVWTKGKKKLGMTAFSKYINTEDPQSASETYLFMKGYRKFAGAMVPAVDPATGDTTTFVCAGDPQTQTGWLDTQPNDRRLMLTAGPFTMEPGDSQEVVAAVLVGQGSDPLNSIGALKLVDQKAQAVFDLNFKIPNPPPSPATWLRGADRQIEFLWDSSPINDVQRDTVLGQEFHFEGFNIYQGETAVGPWTKIATYDKSDDDLEVTLIYNDVLLAGAGGAQRMIVQKGSNSGLQYQYLMNVSQLDGSRLKNNQPYYFSVTSYSYDYLNATEFLDPSGNLLGHLVETLESPISSIEVRPLTFVGQVSDSAEHLSGVSDGYVDVQYVEPDKVTDHTYEIGFKEDLTWFLQDMSLPNHDTLLNNQTNQDATKGYLAADGIMPKVIGLPPGISTWSWEGGTRWLTGEDAFGGNLAWLNGGLWNSDFWGSTINPGTDYVNVEIRFSHTTKQKAYDYLRGGTPNYACIGYFDCPFTIWDVSASPPRQLNAAFVEQSGGALFDSTWFPGAVGTSAREYLIIYKSTYSATPEPTYLNDILNAGDVDIMYVLTPKIRAGHDPATEFVEGQKLIINAAKPNLPADRFRYVGKMPGSLVAANALDNIKTVPNPYYNFYQEEVDQFDRILKFINLPPVPLKIRIFNIAGDLVRTMDRTDIYNSEFVWDVKTDQGLWVASGIYVWLIDAEGLGTKYGKMAIFTEVEQLNIF